MILSSEERAQALVSIIKYLGSVDFEVTHISLDSHAREITSDREEMRAFMDTGARSVIIHGNVPPEGVTYGPIESEDVDASEVVMLNE